MAVYLGEIACILMLSESSLDVPSSDEKTALASSSPMGVSKISYFLNKL
jgi:hypothetical protein